VIWVRLILVLVLSFSCFGLDRTDNAFLEDLEHRSFLYFWEQADPSTGLVRDRARNDGSTTHGHSSDIASIAATGFGLTGICIAADRHWITEQQARDRIGLTLRFLAQRAPRSHGFYYHWMDVSTGERRWQSEFSSIDTALLLGGVLTVRERFRRYTDIVDMADLIYTRVDFQWMLNGSQDLLSHGWRPENGFIPYRWDSYCELMMLYLLAIGSPTHAIPPESWYAWSRPKVSYEGFTYVGLAPLFTYQYSQAWVDFRHRRDAAPSGIDYFENSVAATRAHRAFCMGLGTRFPLSFGPNLWGITASDSPRGYIIWGGPPGSPSIDGTVVPYGPGGSLMFTPDISLPALRAMRGKYGDQLYGHYGFADAFNPTTGWFDTEVIGIDAGITMLSAENLRTGNVWKWFMRNPDMPKAMRLAKFS
jgi:hypothetical protein